MCIRGTACRRPAYSAKHTTVLSLSLKECICLSVQKVKNAGCAHASSCKWSAAVLQGALHQACYIGSMGGSLLAQPTGGYSSQYTAQQRFHGRPADEVELNHASWCPAAQ